MCSLSNRSSSDSESSSSGKNGAASNAYRRTDRSVQLANRKRKLLVVLRQYGIEPVSRSQANDWSILITCPFPSHKGGNERTPSFGYSFEKDIFNCFGCNKSGGAVEFISYKENMDKYLVARKILDEFGGYDRNEELPEDINPQIEKILFEFSSYIRSLIHGHKNDLHILSQIDKINEWFDTFLLVKVPKNKLTIEELEGTILKLKEYLEKYENN